MGNAQKRLVCGVVATLLGVMAAALSGPAYAASRTTTTYVCPPHDMYGRPVLEHSVTASELFCRYEKVPNDYFCRYYTETGLLKQDHDDGNCHPVANHG